MSSVTQPTARVPANLRRVSGIQTNVSFADTQANLARMLDWLQKDEVAASDLIVFPECMLSGYCFSSYDEAWPHAQSIPGPATDAIGDWCRQTGKFVAFGMLERGADGKLYNSCPLVGPNGVVDCYRKIHLPYLGVDRFTSMGQQPYRSFDAGGLRVGVHICYDGSFPESSRCLALEGADLLILPTNWPPGADTFAKYLPNARALENNVYFVSVNRVGTERGFRFIGQSRFCDPNGNPLADAPHEDECVLTAEIDLSKARNKRLVRVPREHVIDRWADRRPEAYGAITRPHSLVRDIEG
ncbi:(R)-stereoselective amidase [Pirellula sp. SH-Sr6A]|uniref:carbon-nitrogen hydrolase family protein n=1 Tax=Pirellula sp. SH-Sr6A TaxID=1632865 RepID=UPI00078D2720|nr:carbon-nitrogen hydrolase family protein [Pirellula sp. SH-Sr6A]AMV35543.1 (R)-stereoselective amidase [Pirellula sp. SH-Sr6A]